MSASTIAASPNPAPADSRVVVAWTGADGGWVFYEGPTVRGYISAGTGDGSSSLWVEAAGTWTLELQGSAPHGHKPKTLASAVLEVED